MSCTPQGLCPFTNLLKNDRLPLILEEIYEASDVVPNAFFKNTIFRQFLIKLLNFLISVHEWF